MNGLTQREQAIRRGVIRQTVTLDSWLRDGATDDIGVIDSYRRLVGFGYIQPDRFPNIRVYFTDGDVKHDRHRLTRGLRVRFNIEPQNPSNDQLPSASTVRLLLPKGTK